MATKIRLMRLGKIRSPHYRIVVADSRTKREGKVIESIGKYHPKENPSFIEVDSERAQYWLSVGAQPTEPVLAILKLTGDWQTFHGKPTESRVQYAEPKPDKKARYDAVVGEVLDRRAKEAEKSEKAAKQDKADKAEKKSAKKAKEEKPEKTEKAEKPAEKPAKKATTKASTDAAPAEQKDAASPAPSSQEK